MNLPGVWYCALRRVNLLGVSYPCESNDFSRSYLKGQSSKGFDLFFHNSSLPGPLSNGLKYVRFWSRFCRVIQSFRKNLPRVSNCAESISQGYHTAQSHSWPRGINHIEIINMELHRGANCVKTRVGQTSFSKERNILAFFCVLYKRTFHSLRSFTFFIKEWGVLCILLRSL